ncbi:MAG: hypothetical protein CSB33_02605 [Desulfobacterales bacterium]|nr:MAG: hypothetical protein CSB33_02605 [Desulfobacterales bacterium]
MKKIPFFSQNPVSPAAWRENVILLFFILAIGCVLTIPFLQQPSLWPDEALYLHIAEKLSVNPLDLTDIHGHFFYKNPPVLMYALSGILTVRRILGAAGDPIVWCRLFIITANLLAACLAFLTGRRLYSEKTGLLAALLWISFPLSNWISLRILNDIPMTFLAGAAILSAMCRSSIRFGLFALAAFLTKFSALPLFLLPLIARIEKEKLIALLYGVLFLSLLLTAVYHPSLPPGARGLSYFIRFIQVPDLYEMMREFAYFPGAVLCVLVVAGMVLSPKQGPLSALFHWICLFGVIRFFLPWITFRVSRYGLPLYLAGMVIAAFGLVRSWELLVARYPVKRIFLTTLCALIAIGIIVPNLWKSHQLINRTARTFSGYDEVGRILEKLKPPRTILTASPRQIKFFAPSFSVVDFQQDMKREDLKAIVQENGIRYIAIDRWSPHQPEWCAELSYFETEYIPLFHNNHVFLYQVK